MSHFIIEEWKEFVSEYESKRNYLVSNLGRVKYYYEDKSEAVLFEGYKVEGYRVTGFLKREKDKVKKISLTFHMMVAMLFIPKESEEQTYVIHLDYDKENNRVDNLKWATYKEMREHGYKSPYVAEGRKRRFEKHGPGYSKLTTTEVIRLKKKLLDPNRKTRLRILAKQFGISEMQLHRIKTGENWGHIKVDVPNNKE